MMIQIVQVISSASNVMTVKMYQVALEIRQSTQLLTQTTAMTLQASFQAQVHPKDALV